ncbi:lactosylceramide 1,3-N-acetyl-beta-D-glucosaminyltransferase A-like [Osmerus mordax]|uniref:lactosylceramide 1,3-N-acetyl-beta-D-glucosaminyltransferase A-like n=1 Tax=Osmerus mordax TaxID=8014 RepID=UPI0035105362
MFVNFRRIRKCQCVQLAATCFVVSLLMVCWDQLDHHVVSHMRSYSYRYLVNSYGFINSSFALREGEASAEHRYLLNHPERCAGSEVLLLLFVKSSPENRERRQAIRDTWGNESYVGATQGESVRVLFVLGVSPDPEPRERRVQRDLELEDQSYGDLIQQDFLDTFHNLTTKLLLQFRWGHAYCRHARFLMTADDDIFVHMPNLVRYLRGLVRSGAAKDLWVGHVHVGAPPIRRKDSKYHVPHELYPWPSYPDYTAGAGYVVSGDAAAKIYQATLRLNSSMYIDDVFMGICANAVGVAPREHVYFSGEGKAPYHPCIYDRMITSHGHADDVRSLWRAATGPGARRASAGVFGKLYCAAVRVALLCKPYYQNTYPCKAAFS